MSHMVQPSPIVQSDKNFKVIDIKNDISFDGKVIVSLVDKLAKVYGNVYCEYQPHGPTGPVNFFYKSITDREVKKNVINLPSQARHHSSVPPDFADFRAIREIKKNGQYVVITTREPENKEDPCFCTIC